MMNKSPKMLAMTTQLIDPTKVFQFIATLKPNGHITTADPENISMNLEG